MKYNNPTKRTHVILVLLLIFIVLALLQSLKTPFSFIEEGTYLLQPYDTKGLMKGGIYLGIYLGSLLAIALAIFTRSKIVALILTVFIGVSYGIDLFLQLVGSNSKGLSFDLFSIGMIEKSRAGDMLLFKTQLIQAVVVTCAVILFISILRFILKRFRISAWISVAGMLALSVAAWGAVTAIFSIVGQSFPAPIKTVSIAIEYYLEDKNKEPRVLAASVKPAKSPKYKTIVWIIDESVGGQYLSLNGFNKSTTPLLEKMAAQSQDFYNYGIVPSIANCSASSNLFLRVGLTNAFSLEEIRNRELKNTLPTIFQYAKRSGFKTHLIDAQVAEGQLQNYLSVTDKSDVDEFITFSRKHLPNTRDLQASKALEKILDAPDEELNFVVLVKWGAHWPYPLTYEKEIFKPAARESYTEMTKANEELITNAYANSLRFTVDDFLHNLVSKRALDDQIIFYTADHGQTLFHNDDPLTHCHSGDDVPMVEFKVPLMAFSSDIKNKTKDLGVNKATQEQLFPTTLELMGYGDDISKVYGPTLSEGVSAETIEVNVGNTGKRLKYRP